MGMEDYYTHTRCWNYSSGEACGMALNNNEQTVWNNTEYSAHLFAKKAEEIIRSHNTERVSTTKPVSSNHTVGH